MSSFMKAVVCALCVLAAATSASAAPMVPFASSAGASISVSQSALGYVKSVLTPFIQSTVSSLRLPKINFNKDGFTGNLFSIHTVTFQMGDLDLDLLSGQGLKLGMTDFYIHIHVHFVAKETGFPWISTAGTAEIYAHHASVTADIDIGEANAKPTIKASNVKANVGNFDIKINDGIIGGLLNLLENLFQNQINNALNNAIQGAVQQMLDNLGKQVQSVNLDIPFTNWGIEGMFGLTANPTITSKYIGMDCLGVVANTKHPVKPPTGVTPPHVPSFSSGAADHYVQLGISTYFFETLAWVYQQAGQLKSIITHSEVPSSVALQLNTSSLSVFAPGLDSKYPNMWCQLDAGVVAPVNVDTSQAMVAVAPFEIAVQPVTASGPETAFTVGCNLTVGLALHVEQGSPQKLAGNFTFLSCPLATVSSKVGSVKVSGLNMLINTIVTETLLPLVNKVLEAGFPMPTMDGLTLTNSEVLEVDNAIIVASDFTLKLQG